MLTNLEGQITSATGTITANTAAKTYCNYSGTAGYSTKGYVKDADCSAIRINSDGLLTNKLVCEDPYCLDAGSWQNWEPKITLDETFVNQIAEDVVKNLIKQKDPLKKNADIDEIEIPPMSGFIEI